MIARNQINLRKEELIYVGIDLHKETHTAVILDGWNTKLGEITFANTPAEFPKLVRKIKKYFADGNKQYTVLKMLMTTVAPRSMAVRKGFHCQRCKYLSFTPIGETQDHV